MSVAMQDTLMVFVAAAFVWLCSKLNPESYQFWMFALSLWTMYLVFAIKYRALLLVDEVHRQLEEQQAKIAFLETRLAKS